MKPRIDLTGMRFGRMLVLRWYGVQGIHSTWWCRCDCGAEKAVTGTNLKGKTKSCGCLHAEIMRKHGHAPFHKPTVEYMAFKAMHERCENPNCKPYRHYGGRGISVCPEWSSFNAFIESVGPRPSPLHSLDRFPNNNGNYEPGNVRWATRIEQANNTRRNRVVVVNGRRLTVSELAREKSIPRAVFYRRLRSMDVESALLVPYKPRNNE